MRPRTGLFGEHRKCPPVTCIAESIVSDFAGLDVVRPPGCTRDRGSAATGSADRQGRRRHQAAVVESGTSLTELCGIGVLNAGKILVRVGSIDRFRSPVAFARYTGTAPIEASSGDVVRHSLSQVGDRQLNCVLHTMAITQIGRETAGRTYYRWKRSAGKRCAA
ncbi:IS110 family transposase [Rhodococcus sp. IEGM 1318]|uniref:IS110 family transposase n=1 Tax=Rhodococcus sp. IEGM 1318 TaxID=3082226 RepID=UPI002955BB9E|nr:IS110 family transposase [Rhodococcus sp. IEGM 1318]MDV8009435.1 IS110 family transposase [Rhodococcus sp. IEGM 1318]